MTDIVVYEIFIFAGALSLLFLLFTMGEYPKQESKIWKPSVCPKHYKMHKDGILDGMPCEYCGDHDSHGGES